MTLRRGLRLKGRAGISMIETIMALAMLAVAFLALMGAMTSSQRLGNASTEDEEAVLIAQNKLEELKAAAQPGGSTFPGFGNLLQCYTQQTAAQGDLVQPLAAAISSQNWPASFGMPNNSANAPHGQAGWTTAAIISSIGPFKEVQHGSRLRNPIVTIHFMTATEFQASSGISNIGIADTPAVAAGGVDTLDLTTGLNTPNGNFSFLPVKVQVSWWSQLDPAPNPATMTTITIDGTAYTVTRTIELIGAVMPIWPKAQ